MHRDCGVEVSCGHVFGLKSIGFPLVVLFLSFSMILTSFLKILIPIVIKWMYNEGKYELQRHPTH